MVGGGAISVDGEFVSILASDLEDNMATSQNGQADGGALLLTANISAEIWNCVFAHNSASNSGGAFALVDTSLPTSLVADALVSLDTCAFWNNTSDLGGAVFFGMSVTMEVTNFTEFYFNTAASYGGAIYFATPPAGLGWIMNDSVAFGHNSAKVAGGAIYLGSVIPLLSGLAALCRSLSGNYAHAYGQNCASLPVELSLSDLNPLHRVVWPGKNFALDLVLWDSFQNVVVEGSWLTALQSQSEGAFRSGIPQDTVRSDPVDGSFDLPAASIWTWPNSSLSLTFTARLDVFAELNYTVSYAFWISDCPPGSRFSHETLSCLWCSSAISPDQYSMTGAEHAPVMLRAVSFRMLRTVRYIR